MEFSFGFNKSDGLRGWNNEFNDGFMLFYSIPGYIAEQFGL